MKYKEQLKCKVMPDLFPNKDSWRIILVTYLSIIFIIFLLITILLYYIFPKRIRWCILLIASAVFYWYAGYDKFLIVIVTSLIVWLASWAINRQYCRADQYIAEQEMTGKEKAAVLAKYKRKCRNLILIPTICLIVGTLAYCKFGEMLAEALWQVFALYISWDVIVPIGISYYTFSSVGYLLDVYWRKARHIGNYFKFALCVLYFPQIVQGPIARYNRLEKELFQEHPFDFKQICFGIQLMLYGYAKKMILADRLSFYTTEVFGNLQSYEGLVILIAVIASAFQIYMDFSGCMDIVRGASQIFGVTLEHNFLRPFFSTSTAEFWRRWHITLGTWFKDYIYMPVAVSKWLIKLITKIRNIFGKEAAKVVNTIIPLLIVWLLTGIWHGTGWNYVVWGLYYGTIIICSTLLTGQYKKLADFLHIDRTTKSYRSFQMVRTFIIFAGGRLITAPGTLMDTWVAIQQMFSSFNPWIFWDGTLYGMGLDYKDWCVVIIGLILVRRISILQEKESVREAIARRNIVLRWIIYYAVFFAILIFGMYGPGYNASDFIYGNF